MRGVDNLEIAMAQNNSVWDRYYKTYQGDTDIPGVKYPNEHLVRFIDAVSKKPPAGAGRRVLELGFGNITNMAMMGRYGFSVSGLEVSRDAVKRAKDAIKAKNLEGRLSVGLFEGEKLPVGDATVDILVGLQCVYYNLDQNHFAKECHRVLRPGGRIFFSFFSPRHGYMKYIYGKPGSVVRFNEEHPNPRLRNLELFLFKSRDHIKKVYGRYFDIEVGLDEYDIPPVFMSWYYIIGRKKGVFKDRAAFVSRTPLTFPEKSDKKRRMIKIDAARAINTKLWDRKYERLYNDDLMPGNKYPNEYLIRFLTTRYRGGADKFYNIAGNEEKIRRIKNDKVLEIPSLNIANLLMAREFNYAPYGLFISGAPLERSREALKRAGQDKEILLDSIKGDTFPYNDGTFDVVMTDKMASYIPDQKKLAEETARVLKKDGSVFMGYLALRHGYMKWARPLGGGYYRITQAHPDPTMAGMIIYVKKKKALEDLWKRLFDVETKFVEFDLHRYFMSFYFVKGKKRG